LYSLWQLFLARLRTLQPARHARKRSRAALGIMALETRTTPSVFMVSTSADSGHGSFRQALLDSNAATGSNRIAFQIKGLATINLHSALPTITNPVSIDGTTEYGGQMIKLNGLSAGPTASGLTIATDHTTVRGLLITSFKGDGVLITGKAATDNRLVGDQLVKNGRNGVAIADAANNTVGGGGYREGNVIAGNHGDGVYILGAQATHNRLTNNLIGATGVDSPAGNGVNGVEISLGASYNVVSSNEVVANAGSGVWIHDAGTNHNYVSSNFIGTDLVSDAGLGNQTNGVAIGFGAAHNTVGGGNVIGNNTGTGVYLFGAGTTGNRVSGNFIGTDQTGTVALPNTLRGVDVEDNANGNTIGGRQLKDGNVIAFNGDFGVMVGSGASQDAILSNSIFRNGADGIYLSGGNNDQAAPTLKSAVVKHGDVILTGTLPQPHAWVLLQVFNDGPAGQVRVFSEMVRTDKHGNFHVKLVGVDRGDQLTATVTVNHDTSAFAADVTVA
jgi:hypothetical protein